MDNEKVEVPIKVTLDSEDIKKIIKDDENSQRNSYNERNKLLLKLIIHAYDENEKRNELVDSKNSQMIVLTGAMLTLQATLIPKLLVDNIFLNSCVDMSWRIFIVIFMFSSLGFYIYTMILFINAYTFKDNYSMVPNPEFLIECNDDETTADEVIDDMLGFFNNSVIKNNKLILDKVNKGKEGFKFLKISGGLTFILLLIIFYVIGYYI